MGRQTHRTCRSRRERGAALVEFALVMPLLLILVFGAIDFGYMINRDTLVNNAARDGARAGSLNPDKDVIENVVRSQLSDLDQDDVKVTVTCRKPDNTPCGTFETDATPGGVVVVKVEYTYTFLSFAAPAVGLGETLNLSKTIEMRIE